MYTNPTIAANPYVEAAQHRTNPGLKTSNFCTALSSNESPESADEEINCHPVRKSPGFSTSPHPHTVPTSTSHESLKDTQPTANYQSTTHDSPTPDGDRDHMILDKEMAKVAAEKDAQDVAHGMNQPSISSTYPRVPASPSSSYRTVISTLPSVTTSASLVSPQPSTNPANHQSTPVSDNQVAQLRAPLIQNPNEVSSNYTPAKD